ncbi:hypothetical protein C8Q75DRAFT_806904 [Abortiporus biennis]|nr:hypothetical protein C8Q75DRAFT_806904 [Abortiporus biennis]
MFMYWPTTLVSFGLALTSLSFVSLPSTATPMLDIYKRDDPAGLHDVHTGEVAFFSPGIGACGESNVSSDNVVSVNIDVFNQFRSVICNDKFISVTAFGKTLSVKIVDECPTCDSNGLHLSVGAFEFFAPESTGEFQAQWFIQ